MDVEEGNGGVQCVELKNEPEANLSIAAASGDDEIQSAGEATRRSSEVTIITVDEGYDKSKGEVIPGNFLQVYVSKILHPNPDNRPPPFRSVLDSGCSSLLSFVGVLVAALFDRMTYVDDEDKTTAVLLVASFGATAVLLYDAHNSPLAQPRHVFFGHVFGALAGVLIRKCFNNNDQDTPDHPSAFAKALAVSLSILFMNATNTTHPPGGATALVAITGGKLIQDMGFFLMAAVAVPAAVMILVAVLGNNMFPHRHYPLYW